MTQVFLLPDMPARGLLPNSLLVIHSAQLLVGDLVLEQVIDHDRDCIRDYQKKAVVAVTQTILVIAYSYAEARSFIPRARDDLA